MKRIHSIFLTLFFFSISSTAFLNAQAEPFTSFDVQPCTGNTVVIKWAIAPGADSFFYEVERSYDKTKWDRIAHVASQSCEQYFIIDSDPRDGLVYYRVRKAIQSGSFVYSDVKWVQINREKELYLWPNQTRDVVHVKAPYAKGNVELLDQSGKLVLKVELTNYAADLAVSCLNKGTYVLRVRQGDELLEESFIRE